MDIISLLPDSVANQIAAGEVIQRPASVIKELVENAVDAGATVVNVLVVDAGRTSIQVIDNGQGMSETDARLAFERHATSKIRKADDLFSLHTMGFRGEALPSVAAVAQVELTTRTAEEQLGTKLTIAASKVISQEPVSCPVGANFRVENLFFNVPARRKFLKSNATELSNIMTAFERIALVYPDIAFTLHSNGTEVLNLKAAIERGQSQAGLESAEREPARARFQAASLRQRIADVFGKRFNHDILPVEVSTGLCRITGFVGKPESAKKKGSHDYFFVNGRFMKHAYFHKAVLSAYERLIPEGTQVPYFIYFEVDPADIDVNIHPTKTEIKFENEQSIWQILSAAVRDAIGRFCEVPSIEFDVEGRPDIPVFDPTSSNIAAPRVHYDPAYNPFSKPAESHRPSAPDLPSSLWDSQEAEALPQTEPFSLWDKQQGGDSSLNEDRSPVHYQYKGRYIMTAVKSGLMIIDQHRADIRICYERFLARQSAHDVRSQQVLFPETIQLPPSDAVRLEQLLPELASLGFDLSNLGANTYAINGIPADLTGMDVAAVLRELLSVDSSSLTSRPSPLTPHLLVLARSAAIPYGQVLSNEEMESIVNQLFACSNVNYTPDGKAILCILPQHDIEQLLG